MSYSLRAKALGSAARHVSLSRSRFLELVKVGNAPQPIEIGGRPCWDTAALDAWRSEFRRASLFTNLVYVIGFLNYVKIGITADLRKRVAYPQVAVPEELTVYAAIYHDDCSALEVHLHNRFAVYATRGEWFRKEGALAEWIDDGCVIDRNIMK